MLFNIWGGGTIMAYVCIKGNKIEVGGVSLMLGEISAAALSITRKEFEKMYESMSKADRLLFQNKYDLQCQETTKMINALADGGLEGLKKYDLNEGTDEELAPGYPELNEASEHLARTAELMNKYQIFQLFNMDSLEGLLNETRKYAETINDRITTFKIIKMCYNDIKDHLDDLFVFNKTILKFIIYRLMKLEKRNASEYIKAYADFTQDDEAWRNVVNPFNTPKMNYDFYDKLYMQLYPMETDDGTYVIAEYYAIETVQFLLKLDFLKALSVGHQIRRCESCGRFFMVTKGFKTKYCPTASPIDPNKTCEQVARREKRMREKKADDPKTESYNRCITRLTRMLERGSITEEQKQMLVQKAAEYAYQARFMAKYSDKELEEKLSSKNLYRECGMTPPKRGRPPKNNSSDSSGTDNGQTEKPA